MDESVRSDYAFIARKCPAEREVEFFAVRVGHDAARFLYYYRARCVVPYLLDVVLLRRESQVYGRVAPREDGVFALAVYPDRGGRHAEDPGYARGIPVRGMGGFDRLAERRVFRVADIGDRYKFWRIVLERAHRRAAPSHPAHYSSPVRVRDVEIERQVRASEHAQHDAAVLDQREGHRVLLAP